MHSIIQAIAIVVATTVAVGAQTPEVIGTWAGSLSDGFEPFAVTFVFEFDGAALTGYSDATIGTEEVSAILREIAVEGSRVTFWLPDPLGQRIEFAGVVSKKDAVEQLALTGVLPDGGKVSGVLKREP